MVEIPLKKYCEITQQSRQTVYNKIENGKLRSKKDEKGRVFIVLDINPGDVTGGEQVNDPNAVNQLEEVKELYGNFVVEHKNMINKLEESHKRELETVKQLHQEITKMKDDKIDEQSDQIKSKDELLKEKEQNIKELQDKIEKLKNRSLMQRIKNED